MYNFKAPLWSLNCTGIKLVCGPPATPAASFSKGWAVLFNFPYFKCFSFFHLFMCPITHRVVSLPLPYINTAAFHLVRATHALLLFFK
jgi:hypothetical protein